MRKTWILFFLCLLCQLATFGQALYKEGYILTSPFDTTRGQIKYTSYNKASLKCTFRDLSGKATTYSPTELFGYGVEDQLFFISKSIGASNNQFLEVVYQGTVILYAYRDKNQKDYFYLENPKTGQLEILTQKIIRRQNKSITIKAYLEVLEEMLDKSELMAEKLNFVEYNHNSLANFLLEYDLRYAQFQGRIFQGFKKRWPPSIAVYGQTGYSYLSLNGFESSQPTNTYGLGVKFQKEISRGTGRLHLDLDIAIRYEDYEGFVFNKEASAGPESIVDNGFNITLFATDLPIQGPYLVKNTINLERYIIDLPINLKYFFPSEKWTFSLNTGLHPSITVSQSGMIDGQVIQEDAIVLGVNSKLDINKFRPGLNFGFGLYFKTKGTLFIDFQHSPAWLDQGNANFSYHTLRLGYLFNR